MEAGCGQERHQMLCQLSYGQHPDVSSVDGLAFLGIEPRRALTRRMSNASTISAMLKTSRSSAMPQPSRAR